MCRKKNYPIDLLDRRYVHMFCCSSLVTVSFSYHFRENRLNLECSPTHRVLIPILAHNKKFDPYFPQALGELVLFLYYELYISQSFSIGVSTFVDFLCIIALGLSILDEMSLFSVPFLIDQVRF